MLVRQSRPISSAWRRSSTTSRIHPTITRLQRFDALWRGIILWSIKLLVICWLRSWDWRVNTTETRLLLATVEFRRLEPWVTLDKYWFVFGFSGWSVGSAFNQWIARIRWVDN
jgi:hypothetical protein